MTCLGTVFKPLLTTLFQTSFLDFYLISNQKNVNTNYEIPVSSEGEISTVFASDYLNKISGEKIERECKRQIDTGCKTLVVNFKDTEIVNSIGVSILLGVIDAAANAGTQVIFSEVSEETNQLFEMLGLTNHVKMAA